jgi:hypothetical protein
MSDVGACACLTRLSRPECEQLEVQLGLRLLLLEDAIEVDRRRIDGGLHDGRTAATLGRREENGGKEELRWRSAS